MPGKKFVFKPVGHVAVAQMNATVVEENSISVVPDTWKLTWPKYLA